MKEIVKIYLQLEKLASDSKDIQNDIFKIADEVLNLVWYINDIKTDKIIRTNGFIYVRDGERFFRLNLKNGKLIRIKQGVFEQKLS